MGKAPKPDPQIGKAAMESARLGGEMLEFMKGQAAVTNRWADEDRSRFKSTFEPVENGLIADMNAALDPAKQAENANARGAEAAADVTQQFALQRGSEQRRAMAMGISPDSGRFMSANRGMAAAEALATAGATNMGRRSAIAENEAKAENLRSNVLNIGRGMAVNPATSMGLSNSAGNAGFNGAMSGQAQKGSLLNTQFQQQMQGYNARMNAIAGVAGAAGAAVGATNGFGLMPAAWTA